METRGSKIIILTTALKDYVLTGTEDFMLFKVTTVFLPTVNQRASPVTQFKQPPSSAVTAFADDDFSDISDDLDIQHIS